jgi:hypothetical protein
MVVIHFAAAELYGGQRPKQACNLSEEAASIIRNGVCPIYPGHVRCSSDVSYGLKADIRSIGYLRYITGCHPVTEAWVIRIEQSCPSL